MDDNGGMFRSIHFWQGWAVTATAAALFTFVANAEFPVEGHAPDYVAIIGDADAPLWVVNADLRNGVVEVRAGAAASPPDGERYTLWLAAPNVNERLGALPAHRARATYKLTKTTRTLLDHRRAVGVVSEPVGEEDDRPARLSDAPKWRWQAKFVRL